MAIADIYPQPCACCNQALTEEDMRRILREELMNHRFRVLSEEDFDNPEIDLEC